MVKCGGCSFQIFRLYSSFWFANLLPIFSFFPSYKTLLTINFWPQVKFGKLKKKMKSDSNPNPNPNQDPDPIQNPKPYPKFKRILSPARTKCKKQFDD